MKKNYLVQLPFNRLNNFEYPISVLKNDLSSILKEIPV